jgi:hypothetical protein
MRIRQHWLQYYISHLQSVLPVNKVELFLHEPDVGLHLLEDVLRLAVLRLRLLHLRHNLQAHKTKIMFFLFKTYARRYRNFYLTKYIRQNNNI